MLRRRGTADYWRQFTLTSVCVRATPVCHDWSQTNRRSAVTKLWGNATRLIPDILARQPIDPTMGNSLRSYASTASQVISMKLHPWYKLTNLARLDSEGGETLALKKKRCSVNTSFSHVPSKHLLTVSEIICNNASMISTTSKQLPVSTSIVQFRDIFRAKYFPKYRKKFHDDFIVSTVSVSSQ